MLIIGPGVTEHRGRLRVGSRTGELVDELAPRLEQVVYFGEAGHPDDARAGQKPRLYACEARNVRIVQGRARRVDGRGRLRAVLAPAAWLPRLRLIRGAAFVHIWMPSFPGVLAHLLCRLSRRPYSLYFVSDWEEIAPFASFASRTAPLAGWRLRLYRRMAGWAERTAVRHARFTLVDGRGLQRRLAHLHPRVVEAIPRLDMRATDVYERDDTCRGGVVSLLHVGSIIPRKAVLLLVEALRILTERGRQVRLQLVGGGDRSYEATVRAAVLRHDLAERIEFLGYIADVPALLSRYRSADIFVSASLGEGFPRVLIEAASQGLPVVAGGIGTIAATLRDGREALLVEPGSGEALADGVERVMGDAGLRRTLIREGYAFARAHFDRGRPSAQLLELLRASWPGPIGSER